LISFCDSSSNRLCTSVRTVDRQLVSRLASDCSSSGSSAIGGTSLASQTSSRSIASSSCLACLHQLRLPRSSSTSAIQSCNVVSASLSGLMRQPCTSVHGGPSGPDSCANQLRLEAHTIGWSICGGMVPSVRPQFVNSAYAVGAVNRACFSPSVPAEVQVFQRATPPNGAPVDDWCHEIATLLSAKPWRPAPQSTSRSSVICGAPVETVGLAGSCGPAHGVARLALDCLPCGRRSQADALQAVPRGVTRGCVCCCACAGSRVFQEL